MASGRWEVKSEKGKKRESKEIEEMLKRKRKTEVKKEEEEEDIFKEVK